jgi:hypothetical protein
MKNMKTFSVYCFLLPAFCFGQKVSQKTADKILEDGQVLYALEMASITSLDIFYDKEYDAKAIKGYFSYFEKDTLKTVFYSEIDTASPVFKEKDTLKNLIKGPMDLIVVNITVKYVNKAINKAKAILVDKSRKPSEYEKKLFDIRFKIYKLFNDDPITFVKYENSSLSIIILDKKKEYEVWIMTVMNDKSFVPIGNDYFLKYDKTGALIEKKRLHTSLIPLELKYLGKKNDEVKSSFHNHKGESAPPYITPTDICILMLFKPITQWDLHYVYSDKYVSVYNMYSGKLSIVLRKDFEKNTKVKEDPDDLDKKVNEK